MRLRYAWQFTAVVASAVVAGLLGVSGTLALWSASASSNAGTVHAADFRVTLDGKEITGDSVATVELGSPTTSITPASPAFVPMVVTLTSNATSPFEMEADLGAASISHTSLDVAASLVVTSAAVPSGDCALASAESATSRTSRARLGKGERATFCVRIALAEGAPASAQSSTAQVTLPITLTQVGA